MRFNRRYFLYMLFFAVVIVLFLPIKIDYSFKSTARIYPFQEWYLKRGQDDSYISELSNFETNFLSNIKSYKFERGDVSEVVFAKNFENGDFITKGDTLAYINSFYIENEITKIKNLKAAEEENLSMSLSGEKQSLIQEANQKYNFAKQQLELEKKNYIRYKKLFEDSIISVAEFELYENTYELAQINLEIAQNELVTIQTGAKDEEINYILSKIEGYQKELESYERLKDQYYVVSPINGRITYKNQLNEILTISDTSKYILKIPVKINNAGYINKITGVKLAIPGYSETVDAQYIGLDKNVNLFSDQQIFIAKALIDVEKDMIYQGMAVQCTVICDEVSLLKFLKRNIKL